MTTTRRQEFRPLLQLTDDTKVSRVMESFWRPRAVQTESPLTTRVIELAAYRAPTR